MKRPALVDSKYQNAFKKYCLQYLVFWYSKHARTESHNTNKAMHMNDVRGKILEKDDIDGWKYLGAIEQQAFHEEY